MVHFKPERYRRYDSESRWVKILLITNNLCPLSCGDTQFALRGAVFFVLLFLRFFSKDKQLAQDIVADDDYYLYDECDNSDPSIRIEM